MLFAPEIPANTGNIGRLCLGANCELHLVKPFKFFLNDKYLKRAGLDYWDKVKLFIHDDWVSFMTFVLDLPEIHKPCIYLCETNADTVYTKPQFKLGDIFVFGSETKGLPQSVLSNSNLTKIYIPMSADIRSVNLCNSVAIILYEAMRQTDFVL